MQTLLNNNQTEQLNKYLELVASNNFPIRKYENNALYNCYNNLINNNTKKISNTAMQIIEHFHPSIWRCNVNNYLAPMDAWNDLCLMESVILNRFKYLNTYELDLIKIRAGLSIGKMAPRVSVFRPALAKYLINKYLNQYSVIFDPCSGFSGRMLGTCCLGKQYIGQDVNSITVKESNNIINFFNLNAKVNPENSIYNKGEYDCLFTCPPYGDKENWHQDIEVLTSDEWIDVCLNNYNCKSYLFVVDKTRKYNNNIVEQITNSSHLGVNCEKVVLIRR